MARRSRIDRAEVVPEQKSKPGRLERGSASALVMEQAQLSNEADVCKRDVVADQKGALWRQRLFDARQIGYEAVLHAAIEFARHRSIAQGQQIKLPVARE